MRGSGPKGRSVMPYLVVLLFSGFLYYRAQGIASIDSVRLGPAFWPKTVLALSILTCAIAIANRLFMSVSRRAAAGIGGSVELERGPSGGSEVHPRMTRYYPLIGIGLTVAYISVFARLGYFLSTIIYVTAFIYFGNFRRLWIAALIGVLASFVFMFIFMRVVYVSLPVGSGPFLDVSMFVMGLLGIR
jgi:putative tricarboxylic transport membrane protein